MLAFLTALCAISQVIALEECTGAVCSQTTQPSGSALLQVKKQQSHKTSVAEQMPSGIDSVGHESLETQSQHSLMRRGPDLSYTGASAPINAAGYASVASMCCPLEARVFGRRMAIHLGYDICNIGDLSGLMNFFFCESQNRTFDELTASFLEGSVVGLPDGPKTGECAWLATAGAGTCRVPFEKPDGCAVFNGTGGLTAVIGTRGTCCYPSAAIAFEFSNADVIANNLGGTGPNTNDPEELRFTGAGEKDGRGLDLVITVDSTSPTYSGSTNNGLNGKFGIIGVEAGTSVDLTFRIEDSLTRSAVILDEFYVSLLDIDEEKERISEKVYVKYDNELIDRVLEPRVPAITETELPDGRTVYESTQTAGAWNNPTDPMVLGVVNNPNQNGYGEQTVNQRTQALMFIFRGASTWKMTLEATLGTGNPHTRNFIFGGTSAIIDICPRKQEPQEPTEE